MSTASMHHAAPVPVAAVNVPVAAAPIAPTTSDRHAADHLLTLANFAAATPYSTAGSAAPADPGAAVPAPSAATNDGAAYQMYATYPATVQYHGDAGQQQQQPQQQQQQYFQHQQQQQQQQHQYAPTTHAQPHTQTVYSYLTMTEAATTQQQYSASTHAQTAVYQYPSSSDAATQQQQAQQPYSQQHQQQYATQQPQDHQQYATQPQQQQHAPQYTQSQPPLPPATMYAHPTAAVTATTSTTTTGALPAIREDVAYAVPPDSWSSRPRTAPTVPLPHPTTTTTAAPPLPSPIEVSSRQVAHLPYEIPLPERRFSTNDVPIGGRLFRTPAASPRSLSISAPSAAYVQGYLPDNPAPAVGAPTSLASSTFIDSSAAAPGAAVAAEASAVSHQQYHHHHQQQQQQQHVAATAYTNAVPATGATYQYAGATWAVQQQQPSQQQQQHYVYHYPAQHQYVAQSASGTATTSEYAGYAAPTARQQYQQQQQGPDAYATTGDARGALVHADMGSLRLDEQQLQQLQQQQQLKQQSSTHSPLATQGDLASTDASPATVTIARTASKKRKRLIGAAGVPAPPSGPSTADVSPADTAAPASFPTSPMPAFAMDPVTGIQPSPLLASPDVHGLRSKKTRTAPGEDDEDPARTDPVSLGAPANALHVAWTSTAAGDPGPVTYHQMAAAPPAAVPVDPAATAHMYSALASSMPLTTPAAVAMAYPMHASQMAAVPPLPPPVAPGGGASSAGSPADRAGDKSDPIPRVQKLRFPGDLYTPRLVRYTGAAKEGLCDLCPQGKFLQLKNSAFWYHKQFYHGISSVSGLPFVEPIERRTVTVRVPPASSKSRKSATAKAADPDEPPAAAADATADAVNGETPAAAAVPPKPPVGRRDSVQRDKLYTVIEGLCHQCQQWIPLTSAKRRTSAVLWYRHAHKCHEYEKPSSLHGAAMLVTAAAASSTHPVSYNPVQYATDPATGAAYAVDPAAAAAAVAGGYGMVAQPHQAVGNGAAVMYAAAAAAAGTPMDMASAAAAAAMTAMAAGSGAGGASESPTLTLSQQHGGPYHHTEYAVHAGTPTGYLQQSMHEHQQHQQQHQQQTQQQSQQPIELQPQAMYPLEAAAVPPPQLSQQAYAGHPQYHAYVDQQQPQHQQQQHQHHQQQQQHQQLQQQQQQQYQYASQPDPSQLQQSYAQQVPSLQGTMPAQHVPEQHQQSQPQAHPQAPAQPGVYGASAYPQYATHSGTPGHQ